MTHHPHDIAADQLERAIAEATRPDLLREVAATSRAVFGFFPNHYPYTLNYPWLLERLEPLPAGAHVLDIGAGVSPLPIVLANRGLRVDCVDNSEIVRQMPVEADWNEWGFFDYAVVDARIQSYHRDVREHMPAQPYDCIYSVSALAHMTRADREETVYLAARWLKPGGRLLVEVDLDPSDGLPVEPFGWLGGRTRARARKRYGPRWLDPSSGADRHRVDSPSRRARIAYRSLVPSRPRAQRDPEAPDAYAYLRRDQGVNCSENRRSVFCRRLQCSSGVL